MTEFIALGIVFFIALFSGMIWLCVICVVVLIAAVWATAVTKLNEYKGVSYQNTDRRYSYYVNTQIETVLTDSHTEINSRNTVNITFNNCNFYIGDNYYNNCNNTYQFPAPEQALSSNREMQKLPANPAYQLPAAAPQYQLKLPCSERKRTHE